MSKSNREGKALARERAAQLKIEQARRARRNRMFTVYGSTLGVLVVALVVALIVQNIASSKNPPLAPSAAVADITGGISTADGMAIPIGDSNAPVKLTVYEDFRCSECGAFESTYQTPYKALVKAGTLELLIHPVILIDSNIAGTSGSLHSGNAAACAQDAGKFEAYHDILYTNQPAESTDSFASDTTLITLAKQVPGLDTKAFESCVTGHKYFDWVRQNYEDLKKMTNNQPATPTIFANGTKFTLPTDSNTATAQADFTKQIDQLAGVNPSGSASASASGSAGAGASSSSSASPSSSAGTSTSAPASSSPSKSASASPSASQ
jgi:protein-disulfide isomerase